MQSQNLAVKHVMLSMLAMFIITGLVMAGLFPGSGKQTAVKCMCGETTGKHLHLCNSFSRQYPVFLTGVLNIVVEKSGKTGVVCQDGEETGTVSRITSQEYHVKTLFSPPPR